LVTTSLNTSCDLIENNTTKSSAHNVQLITIYENETEHLKMMSISVRRRFKPHSRSETAAL
jgi:protoheme ferro-lyase